MPMPIVKSVNISKEKGTVKIPVDTGLLIADHGLEGDAHAGAWHRQVSLLAQESVDRMAALGAQELTPGIFAENITTQGLALHLLALGTRLQIGEALVEVTQIGKECHQHCEVFRRVGQCVMPTEGIFVQVLKGGMIHAGDTICVQEKQCNETMEH